jgi:glucokinase
MYLAGDLGGTKTLLGLFEPTDDGLKLVHQKAFPSRDFATFESVLAEFLAEREGPLLRAACFGVAGTVIRGQCKMTNLPWSFGERALASAIGVPRVKLLNDLEATAFGMLSLPADDLAVIQPGSSVDPSRAGNIGVIAAGTGLGEAMLFWDGSRYHPIASEGGHADFGPRTELEVDLWRYLFSRFGGHVSYERVLSGPGFLNIYDFLRDRSVFEEPSWLAEEIKAGDPNVVISAHGLKGDVPICTETVALFASLYGAEAGNMALRCVATGGVFVGGGIAPKLLPVLRSDHFREGFTDKGRFAEFLAGIEVCVALNPEAALIGAAHYAAGRL